MQLSLLVVQIFAATAVLSAPLAVKRQQIGSDRGSAFSNGPSAVNNPEINNGWKVDSSIIDQGRSGGNLLNNVFGSTFVHTTSNSVSQDNIVNNPSHTTINGNPGSTANGQANNIGNVLQPLLFNKRNVIWVGYY